MTSVPIPNSIDGGTGTAKPQSTMSARQRLLWQDMGAVATLALLGLLLFRAHVFGNDLYIGNPDRLNSNLKILKFYVDGLASGHLDAWSQFEMMGYDTFALPYTFPSIFLLIGYLIGPDKLYAGAGYELPLLLFMAGVSAYAFIRIEVGSVFPAVVGAVLYQFSALTILKVSQNDLSFSVFILIPLIMMVIRLTDAQSMRRGFLLLTALIFLMLHFTFLQKASYAMILAGTYCLYRSITRQDWRLLAVFAAACVTGIIGAFPRIYGVALAMREYSRTVPGLHLDKFADIYQLQAIFPSQILRWFDGGIFGYYPSDATITLQNNINVTEGFLLYTSSFVPFLILFGIFLFRDRSFALVYSRRHDAAFFFWFLVFTMSVITVPPVLELVWLLYLRMDFTHARILIIGLLPLSVLVALVLADLRPRSPPAGLTAVMLGLLAAGLAVLLVTGMELIAQSFEERYLVAPLEFTARIRYEAIATIAMSLIAVAGLLVAMHVLNHSKLAYTAYWTLGLAIALQTFLGADYQINGSYTHTGAPFLNGNNYYSTKANFRPPTPDAVAALNRRLDNDNYRSVLLCDPNIAGGFCAGHIPEFWRIRVVDGYYGLGVPRRVAALPWHWSVGLRTISHHRVDQLDWPILALLNVKYLVTVDETLYRNNSGDPGEAWRPASPDAVQIETNPLPVVPRYFFARNVVPVSDAAQAAVKLFDNGKLADVIETSFVENFPRPVAYSAGGTISSTGSGDRVKITVEPAMVDRFLVANELFFPGWTAAVDGRPASIYPTNAVMRGVVVPAGATVIDFVYTPFTRHNISIAFYAAALLLAGIGGFAFGRPPLRV